MAQICACPIRGVRQGTCSLTSLCLREISSLWRMVHPASRPCSFRILFAEQNAEVAFWTCTKSVENHDPYTVCKRKFSEEDRRRKSIPNHSKRRKSLVSRYLCEWLVPGPCAASSGARHGRSDKASCSSSASRGASLLRDAGSWRQRHQWASSGSHVVRTTLRQPEVASSVSSSSASEATSRTSPCRVTTVACRERDN